VDKKKLNQAHMGKKSRLGAVGKIAAGFILAGAAWIPELFFVSLGTWMIFDGISGYGLYSRIVDKGYERGVDGLPDLDNPRTSDGDLM
jgi:hypothetical protein